MNQLNGKLALVTGGAKNVGKTIAKELAARGAQILLNYFHSHEAAKQTLAELEALGAKVELIRASVAQQPQVERMFSEIREKYGYLDILVNNAASGALVPFDEVTDEALDKALNTNFKGSLWCSRAAAPLMAARGGGAIINVSALGGSQFVMANYLACGPAKAAVESLTRYLAAEFAPLNIRVNTASAGMLESEVANSFPRAAEMREEVIRSTPLGRLGKPEDLARVVAFLASDDARWMTGQVVLADGGLSLGTTLLSPPKLAIAITAKPAAIKQPEAELDESEEIAIVGMGLAVPGANDPEQYWRILSEGGNFFIDVPSDRWDNSSFLSPDHSAEDKTYQNKSAFMTGFVPCAELIQKDGEALSQYEFTTLWLRHSLLQALASVKRNSEDRYSFVVGYTADGTQHLEEAAVLSGVTARCAAVIEGLDLPAEEKQALLNETKKALREQYSRSADSPSRFLPDRVGKNAMKDVLPADTEVLMVDTACSSSLYAIDIGIKGLLMGKQDIAICGGAFALAPRGSVLFAKLHGISTSGEVRAFDKTSDGVLFADGAGIVVLKKLSRARRDGDNILAVVKGFGASSDGKGKAIYAPSSAGQSIAIERAMSRPGVELGNIDWVIAHATGTPAGDLAEFTTLRQMIQSGRRVCVTSNKSLIGHTGWAAGVVSVIQAILALGKELIPPQHRFRETPASFEMEKSSLAIPTSAVPWPKRPETPRAVSISGFGFGGTNAHLVLEEYRPQAKPAAAPARAYQERIAIIGWSAHVPGLSTREELTQWLAGDGAQPRASFGDFYPTPSFDKVRMPPGTVRTIDRCQLMILECAHELKAQVGEFWDQNRANSGVFVGHMGTTRNASLYGGRCYLDELGKVLGRVPMAGMKQVMDGLAKETKRLVPPSNEDSFPGSMPNVIPARIANYFDLKGPNMTLDTGLSSAYAAMEVASRYLRAQEVEMTLVGGINGNTTPEMRHIAGDMNLPAGTELAEGAFLFALVTEATARKANLKILGFVDELMTREPQSHHYNYLGAEGAVTLLRALHQENRPAKQELKRAPAVPLVVKRHVPKLKEFPAVIVRSAMEFLPAGTVVITDRPELVASLGSLPEDVCVLTTQTLEGTADASLSVAQALRKASFPITHMRLITSMEGRAAESVTALHELAFLAMKHCHEGLTGGGGSCILLFLDSVSARALHPLAGLFGGLVKCASFEMPHCLTYALFTDSSDLRTGIRQSIQESTAVRFLPVVAYQGNSRKAMFLEQEDAPALMENGTRLNRQSVVVAVAGARGITAEILKAVAEYYQPVLYLIGSNPLGSYPEDIFTATDEEFAARRPKFIREQMVLHPKKNLGQIDKEFGRMSDARAARRNISDMERHCGTGRVHYVACDVLDRGQLERAFDQILTSEKQIDLLINAAGLNRSAPIATKTFGEFLGIRDLKLKGYLNLKSVLEGRLPKTWCNFGSLLGFTGQIGEADYASGNDFLATSACYANNESGYDEYTIGWTLWGSVGLGAKPLTKAYFEKAGTYSNMATEEGVHHFLQELNQSKHAASTVHVGVAEKAAINRLIPGFIGEENAPPLPQQPFYLGSTIRSSSEGMVFERVFNLETDGYLQNHLVNGYATLPGTFVMEIAAEAASQLVPDLEVIGFENIQFQHFLRVYGGKASGAKKIRAVVQERSGELTVVKVQITADITSPAGSLLVRDKPHFELDVILSKKFAAAPYWEPWERSGDTTIADPYHIPVAPVLLTGMFASTRNTRLHPMGQRADYRVDVAQDHPVFSRFRVPCILLDGLARTGVLSLVDNTYLPLVAPRTIRRVDLYERTNDSVLAGEAGIQLYATPREFTLVGDKTSNRFVASRPDGRMILQMKDVTGVLLGYVHKDGGEYVTSAEMEARKGQHSLALAHR